MSHFAIVPSLTEPLARHDASHRLAVVVDSRDRHHWPAGTKNNDSANLESDGLRCRGVLGGLVAILQLVQSGLFESAEVSIEVGLPPY